MTEKIFYVKLTNECQMCCDHCYNSESEATGEICSDAFDSVTSYVADAIQNGNDVTIELHGGEPMLVSGYTLEQAIKYTRGWVKMGAKVTCTTNLCYSITPLMYELFELFDEKTILTSWDYKIRFKRPIQKQTWEYNVKELVSKGFKVQPIITVTKPLVECIKPTEIFGYMKELGISALNFERLTATGRACENLQWLMPTNRQVDEWLTKAYDKWTTKYSEFYVPLFRGLQLAAEGHLTGCRARQCMKNVRTFEPNGAIGACPNVQNVCIGTCGDRSSDFIELDLYKTKNKLIAEEQVFDDNCLICKYFKICHGECSQLKFDETGCPGLKGILEKL